VPEAAHRASGPRAAPTGVAILVALTAVTALSAAGCGSRLLALHAPNVAPATSRAPTRVDIDPIADGAPGSVAGDYAAPGPAAVFTGALKAEIEGRALEGGDAGGYGVRCKLDRFAVRSHTALAEGVERVAVYADLSCEARRTADGVTVWRGELRARTAASGPNVISSDADVTQRLTDGAMSDASREMASDLAVRALGLYGPPSARVFGDEGQLHDIGGLDDTPYGADALAEKTAAVEGALRGLGEHDARMRAAAWNVAAMAAGPGDPWNAGDSMTLDDDALVRFVQYKALARLGSAEALDRLGQALSREDEPLLAEFLRDVVATRGTGFPRKGYDARGGASGAKASPATKGATARP
jgi:hypothetical protein